MRFIIFVTLGIFWFLAVNAVPTRKPSNCNRACPFNYAPVCAGSGSGRGADLSFGNDCVLQSYNCEHPDNVYVKKQNGECPGGAGIRLQ